MDFFMAMASWLCWGLHLPRDHSRSRLSPLPEKEPGACADLRLHTLQPVRHPPLITGRMPLSRTICHVSSGRTNARPDKYRGRADLPQAAEVAVVVRVAVAAVVAAPVR